MAQRVGGRWFRVKDLIDLFCAMGCVRGDVPYDLADDEGERQPVRYLFNPESQSFVSLAGLDDDDLVSPMTVASWERALRIVVPKGDPH